MTRPPRALVHRAASLGLVALTAAACVACTGPQPPSRDAVLSTQSPAGVTLPALREGAVADGVDALDTLTTAIMEKTGIPGLAVAVVHGGETVYAEGFGTREVGTDEPVSTDTVFQLASLSKAIGSTVVARMVTDGTIGWDTPVSDVIDAPLADPYVARSVTVGDLYAHRSGLPDSAGDQLETLGFTRQQILDRLDLLPLSPFRDTYHYTDFGMTLGAEAVARAAGVAWEDLSQEQIYEPLGMTHTSSRHSEFLGEPDRAALHVPRDGGFVAAFTRDADAQSPAGGVSSTVEDLATWMRMLLDEGTVDGRQLIAPEALVPAMSPRIALSLPAEVGDRESSYGYGFDVSTTTSGYTEVSHSGAFTQGAGTTFSLLPELDLGIVVLTNAYPLGVAEALAKQFLDVVQYGSVQFDWLALYQAGFAGLSAPAGDLAGQEPPTDVVPASTDDRYVGTYANDFYGDAVIRRGDAGLELVLGPAEEVFSLTHWSGDQFAFAIADGSAPAGSLSSAIFGGDASGRAATLDLDYFDQDGVGGFTRVD